MIYDFEDNFILQVPSQEQTTSSRLFLEDMSSWQPNNHAEKVWT